MEAIRRLGEARDAEGRRIEIVEIVQPRKTAGTGEVGRWRRAMSTSICQMAAW